MRLNTIFVLQGFENKPLSYECFKSSAYLTKEKSRAPETLNHVKLLVEWSNIYLKYKAGVSLNFRNCQQLP